MTYTKKRKFKFTYFIQEISGGLIKIGGSDNPSKRRDRIQCNCPNELIIIGLLKGDYEKELHIKFKEYNIHHEWFEPELVLKYIKEMYEEGRMESEDRIYNPSYVLKGMVEKGDEYINFSDIEKYLWGRM